MARVTVEDCIDKIPNRYDLVMVAAQRARDISSGAPLCVDRDNDKNSVVALREIAENKVSIEDLQSRGKVSSTTIDKLRTLGVLDGLPETSQLSLF